MSCLRHSALASLSIRRTLARSWRIGGLEQPDDRQRQLLLLEIGAQALAGQSLLSPDVQDVVGDLEGDSQVAAVAVEGLGRGPSAPG